jgi:tetratricopeptide (TPR) repeat protein
VARAILATVIACVVIALAFVQFASDALYRHPGDAFGLRVYRALDRIAPAEYVSDTLASTTLAQGDLDAAQRYALQMPAGERRDDLLAQIAAARGDKVLALEYYFAATDVAAMQREIVLLARTNLRAAVALEAHFRDRLLTLGTHPDAVAESYWMSADFAASEKQYTTALAFDRQALALAPLNMAYILSAASHAYFANDLRDAQYYFSRGVAVNPSGGDAYAGLGLVALREGDRARAQAYLQQARANDPHAPTVASLAAALR